MSASNIASVGGAILGLAYAIQQIGNSYYKSTEAWKAFPVQVDQLKRKLATFKEQVERYGLQNDEGVLERMREAEKLVEKERKKLEDTSAKSGRRFRRVLGGIAFPAKIGAAIQNATEACDRISQNFAAEQEFGDRVRRRARDAPMDLSFKTDDRYVPLQAMESEVLQLLEEPDESPYTVVLLHGAPGTGKSTMVREVSLKLECRKIYSQVAWLECGPDVSVEVKGSQLLQILGWPCSEVAQLNSQAGGSHDMIQHCLKSLLRERNLLIVLDDVWDLPLLTGLLNLSGPGVKYLVTSRKKDLCRDLSCNKGTKPIEMKPVLQEDAQMMLALNAGFADQKIPQDFQERAEKILEQAECIPLVIATLGARICNAGNENMAVWEAVSEIQTFSKSLADSKPGKHIHGAEYPRSYWSTLKHGVDRLSLQQKQLFLLVGMCKGPSVPDLVVRVLYSTVSPDPELSLVSYLESKRHLESLHFFTVKDDKSASMHSMTTSFIVNQMKEDIESMLRTLWQNMDGQDCSTSSQIKSVPNEMSEISKTWVCLYVDRHLDPNHSEHAISCNGHSPDTFSEMRRNIIEPILQLMALSMNRTRGWTEEYDACAKQVFMTYIYQDRLHNDGISKLLGVEPSVLPVVKFLSGICVEASFWQDTRNTTVEGIPEALFRIVRNDTHAPGNEDVAAGAIRAPIRAAGAILLLSRTHKANCRIVVNEIALLEQLKESLTLCEPHSDILNASVVVNLLGTIAFAVHSGDSEIKRRLAADLDLLSMLADFLAGSRNERVQGLAASILRDLTDPSAWKHSVPLAAKATPILIATCPGLLEKVVESFKSKGSPWAKEGGSGILINVAKLQEREIMERVIGIPHVLDNVAQVLTQADGASEHTSVQAVAAAAILAMILTDVDLVVEKIASSPVLVENLAQLLSKDQYPLLQEQAMMALAYLCNARDVSVLREYVDTLGLLDRFIESMANDGHTTVQSFAAFGMAQLAVREDSVIKGRIASHPDLLEALARSLRKRTNAPLQDNAARFLLNLANTTEKSILERIVKCPGLLEKLAESLLDPQELFIILGHGPSPNYLRELAASATATLIAGARNVDLELLKDIVSCSALLDNLAESMLLAPLGPRGEFRQEKSREALAALAPWTERAIADGIYDISKLLKMLGEGLVQAPDSNLQESAARVLYFLSSSSSNVIRDKITSFPGMLKALAEALKSSRDSRLKESIRQTTASLLQVEGGKTWDRISEYSELLDNLLESEVDDDLGSTA